MPRMRCQSCGRMLSKTTGTPPRPRRSDSLYCDSYCRGVAWRLSKKVDAAIAAREKKAK